jgi:hypothetical protein
MEENQPSFEDIKSDIERLTEDKVHDVLDGQVYDKEKAADWAKQIMDSILNELVDRKYGMKFIVNGLIFEKGADELTFVTQNDWDVQTDGKIHYQYKADNNNMNVVFFVFGLAP